jgi:hypothetical protein
MLALSGNPIGCEDHFFSNRLKLMKTTALLLGLLGLLVPSLTRGQVTTNYFDNTVRTVAGSYALETTVNDSATSQIYVQFQTGANAFGYSLNSISLSFAAASGDPSAWPVYVFLLGDTPNPTGPGGTNDLGGFGTVITGSSFHASGLPLSANLYTFTPQSSVTLAPDADYWFEVRSGNTSGAYEWNYTSATTAAINGWSIGSVLAATGTGSVGTPLTDAPLFSINATALTPEPGSLSLAVMGFGAALGFARRHRPLKV